MDTPMFIQIWFHGEAIEMKTRWYFGYDSRLQLRLRLPVTVRGNGNGNVNKCIVLAKYCLNYDTTDTEQSSNGGFALQPMSYVYPLRGYLYSNGRYKTYTEWIFDIQCQYGYRLPILDSVLVALRLKNTELYNVMGIYICMMVGRQALLLSISIFL